MAQFHNITLHCLKAPTEQARDNSGKENSLTRRNIGKNETQRGSPISWAQIKYWFIFPKLLIIYWKWLNRPFSLKVFKNIPGVLGLGLG